MAAMNIISTILASKKAIEIADKVATQAPSMVDQLFHTDEEKSNANLTWFTKWCDMMVQIKDENTARSITRRIIAIFIISVWSVFCVCGLIDVFLGLNKITQILNLADALYVSLVTGAVIAFYFGVNIIDRFRSGK